MVADKAKEAASAAADKVRGNGGTHSAARRVAGVRTASGFLTDPPAAPGDGRGPSRRRSRPAPAGRRIPASPDTPVATTAARVRRLAAAAPTLAELDAEVSVCRACPRLVRWREDVAATKRASFADQPYWGRPIAGWGSPDAGRS